MVFLWIGSWSGQTAKRRQFALALFVFSQVTHDVCRYMHNLEGFSSQSITNSISENSTLERSYFECQVRGCKRSENMWGMYTILFEKFIHRFFFEQAIKLTQTLYSSCVPPSLVHKDVQIGIHYHMHSISQSISRRSAASLRISVTFSCIWFRARWSARHTWYASYRSWE